MRWSPVAMTFLVAVPTALFAGGSVLGLGDSLGTGQATFVEVVETDQLGVVAGLVTVERTGPLGLLGGARAAPAHGWVAVGPGADALEAGAAVTATDDLPFTDPNGATWLAREVATPDGPAWVVPLGDVYHDDTLQADYNWALVVDWDDVPEDADLEVRWIEDLALVR